LNIKNSLTSAQTELWTKITRAKKENNNQIVLLLAHYLLRSVPEFLELRQLARQAAQALRATRKQNFFEKIQTQFQRAITVRKGKMLFKKQKAEEALLLLELFLGKEPNDVAANELMAEVALSWKPPLYSVALFAIETALAADPKEIRLYIKIAELSLQPEETGEPWNPERAIEAYRSILLQKPNHLVAMQGLKNASALFSMKHDAWRK
jgi:tetratricopeptide (TPR) repeat protein